MRYAFRPVTWDDFPMLEHWLHTPEVVRWWGASAEELALLRADMDEPGMTMLIVTGDDVPFAYAQHYAVHTWPQPHLALVAIDPSADNVRAQRAYASAGFRGDEIVETDAGPAVLMLFGTP